MFIAKNNNLILTQANTKEELLQKIKYVQYDTIVEIEEALHLVNGKYVTAEEQARLEKERIQGLSMTPLDFIKALEQLAGITYTQIKKLCDDYPEIDRELRFCQNVYRNNPMLSQEVLAKLPKEFHLTDEQIDDIFLYVDNLKNNNESVATEN